MFSDGQVDADTALMFDLRERLQNETLQAEKLHHSISAALNSKKLR
jgi:hypothetical protein